jgi:hypothetical protein
MVVHYASSIRATTHCSSSNRYTVPSFDCHSPAIFSTTVHFTESPTTRARTATAKHWYGTRSSRRFLPCAGGAASGTPQTTVQARVLSSPCSDFAAAVNGHALTGLVGEVLVHLGQCIGDVHHAGALGGVLVLLCRHALATLTTLATLPGGHVCSASAGSIHAATRASSPSSRPRNTLSPASAHSGSPSWPAASRPDTSSSRTTP